MTRLDKTTRSRVERLWPLLIVAAVAAVYWRALGAGFIWDDGGHVADKAGLFSLAGLARIWLEPGAVQQYYPLTHSAFWLQYRLWGLAPAGYHTVNVLFHAANAVLAGFLLQELGLPGAWWAALLFAVHPVQVETVAWVSELKNLLSTFFSLWTALLYLRARRGRQGRRAGLFAAAFVAFLAALASKTVTCMTPVALGLLLWWKGEFRREDAARLLPFVAVGGLFGLGTAFIERQYIIGGDAFERLSFAQRLLIAGRAPWFYAGKLALPVGLSFNYPRWAHDAAAPALWLPLVVLVGSLALLWRARGRLGRGPACAVAIFLVILFPALGFFDAYPMRYSFVADHFQYAAALALLAPAAFGLYRLPRVVLGGVIVVLAVLSARRVAAFHDEEALWRDTIRANPASVMARNNLGLLLMKEGRLAEGERMLSSAADLDPMSAEAWANLGLLRERSGQLDRALDAYRRALVVEPARYSVRVAEAGVLMRRGDFGAAGREYGRALDDGKADLSRSSPRRRAFLTKQLAVVAANGGVANLEDGKLDEARRGFSESLDLDAAQPAVYFHLARLSLRQHRRDAARSQLRQALALRPDFPEAQALLRTIQ